MKLTALHQPAKCFARLNEGKFFEDGRRILNISSLATQQLSINEIQGWTICEAHMTPLTHSPIRKDQCFVCNKYKNSGIRTVSCFT